MLRVFTVLLKKYIDKCKNFKYALKTDRVSFNQYLRHSQCSLCP